MDLVPVWDSILKGAASILPVVITVLKTVIGILIGLSFPLALALFFAIIYSVERLKVIRKKEAEIYDLKNEPAYESADTAGAHLAVRWETVTGHINSSNPNDWKQAIIEADIMLDDILTKMGYRGESVGEKLKRVVKGDFQTVEDAWDAHKVRNQIAHEAGFTLTEHDAKHTIQKYRKVFEEFYYI